MYLLDTNVVSELRLVSTRSVDPRVKEWAGSVATESNFLSVITVLELEQGTLLMERRDRRQGAALRAWLEETVLPDFAERILPVDLHVAVRTAALHVPDPCSDRDSLIAATALVHGMTLVTRNTADFERTGVQLLNPWVSQQSR
jgi:toxin FitB